jgi:hypothetical protein
LLASIVWTMSISNEPGEFGFVDLIAIALPKSAATMKGSRSSFSTLPLRHLKSTPSSALKRYSRPGLAAAAVATARHPTSTCAHRILIDAF